MLEHEERARPMGTHRLSTTEGVTSQNSKRKQETKMGTKRDQETERHSQSIDHRGRGQVRTPKRQENKKGTHMLLSVDNKTSQGTKREQESKRYSQTVDHKGGTS